MPLTADQETLRNLSNQAKELFAALYLEISAQVPQEIAPTGSQLKSGFAIVSFPQQNRPIEVDEKTADTTQKQLDFILDCFSKTNPIINDNEKIKDLPKEMDGQMLATVISAVRTTFENFPTIITATAEKKYNPIVLFFEQFVAEYHRQAQEKQKKIGSRKDNLHALGIDTEPTEKEPKTDSAGSSEDEKMVNPTFITRLGQLLKKLTRLGFSTPQDNQLSKESPPTSSSSSSSSGELVQSSSATASSSPSDAMTAPEALQKENEKLKQKIKTLKEQLQKNNKLCNITLRELESLKKSHSREIEQLQKERDALLARVTQFEALRETIRHEVEILQIDSEELKKRRQELQDENRRLMGTVQELQKQQVQPDASSSSAAAAAAAAISSSSPSFAPNSPAVDQVSVLLKRNKQESQESEQKNQELQQRLEELEQGNERLQMQHELSEINYEQQIRQIEALTAQISQLQSEKQENLEELTQVTQMIGDTSARVTEISEKLRQKERSTSSAVAGSSNSSSLEEQLHTLQERNNDLQRQIIQLKENVMQGLQTIIDHIKTYSWHVGLFGGTTLQDKQGEGEKKSYTVSGTAEKILTALNTVKENNAVQIIDSLLSNNGALASLVSKDDYQRERDKAWTFGFFGGHRTKDSVDQYHKIAIDLDRIKTQLK